jgi:hypothetical protein
MPYPVRYSTMAYIEYEEIIGYIFAKYGSLVAANVDIYFNKVIDQISINPFLYPQSDKKRI